MNVKKVHTQHHLITACCGAIFLTGIVAYMYFLSLAVVHVVMRNEINQNINQLRSEIAYLEAAYIEANHAISTKVATTEGFSEIKEKIFIRSSSEQGLVLRTGGE